MDELRKQNPATANDGGYQNFLVHLQNKTNWQNGELTLTADDLEKIPRYAFDYKNGGWQNRLMTIFARNLGPRLGRG